MKKFTGIFILFFLILLYPQKALANSDYVLPYPSLMPGNRLYLVQEIKENWMKYWYFGNFGQFTYNLNRADKFLVEAKTLFEYKQYLLADRALKKSDYFFGQIFIYLERAEAENKDISENKKILSQASLKHLEILENLKNELPENFIWQPEKLSPTDIDIHQDINNSIKIRHEGI